jgi:hypothetical protein
MADEKPDESRALKKAQKNFKGFRQLLAANITMSIGLIITCSILIAVRTRSILLVVSLGLVRTISPGSTGDGNRTKPKRPPFRASRPSS